MASSFTSSDATQALQLLSTAAIDRRNELELFEGLYPDKSDEDNGSDAHFFDKFYEEGGAAAILEMTNFSPPQFVGIWAGSQDVVAENYNVGRGRKCAHSAKDVLFMTLAVLKHGGSWDFLARMFGQKTSAFERMIVQFIRMLYEPVYEQYVVYKTKRWSMKMLHDNNRMFKNYPMARYAIDVTFQPSFRPSESIEEGNVLVKSTNYTDSRWRSP